MSITIRMIDSTEKIDHVCDFRLYIALKLHVADVHFLGDVSISA